MKKIKQTSNRSRRFLCLCAACLFFAGSLLSGCGDTASETSTDSAGAAQDTTDVSSSGPNQLVIGTGQTCTTLNPVLNFDGWYTVRFGIGETLTKFNDDFSVSGWLASDYSVSDDDTVWTFTIRDDVTFSNGTKLTADLAAASIENVFENGSRGEEYFSYTDISADGQTLTITTADPEPILPAKLADPLFVIIDTSVDLSNVATEGPVGTGPFMAESFDPTTKEVVVVRNDNYWDGDVALDQVTFLYTEDQTTLTMGLEAGDFDVVYNLSMADIDEFLDSDVYVVSQSASGRTTHGFMNQNGPLGDEVLRQAILRCLDRESFCENLLNGQYVAGKTPVTSASQYGYDELVDINTYDPESASALLDASGYLDLDGDGYRETPDGEKLDLTFVYYTGRPEQQIMVEATQMQCAQIGIQISPQVYDTQTVMDRLETGDYDLCCVNINVLSSGDPEDHLRTYFSTNGYYNSCGYSSDAFDSILDALSVTSDEDERVGLIKEAEQILMDDTVCIYYCYPIMNFVMKANVTGITSTPADYYWINAQTDWRQE